MMIMMMMMMMMMIVDLQSTLRRTPQEPELSDGSRRRSGKRFKTFSGTGKCKRNDRVDSVMLCKGKLGLDVELG